MHSSKLKQVGVVLMAIGAILVLVSTGMMIALFAGAQTGEASPSLFAEGISHSLLPSTVGMPLLIAGAVAFVIGWFRGRGQERTVGS